MISVDTGPLGRILLRMAEAKVIRSSLAFISKAAQCPACFSFNHPEYLPEKKIESQASGMVLTCAVCGTPYPATEPQAA